MATAGELPPDFVPPNMSAYPPAGQRSPDDAAHEILWQLYARAMNLDAGNARLPRPDAATMGAVVMVELTHAARNRRSLAMLAGPAARLADVADKAGLIAHKPALSERDMHVLQHELAAAVREVREHIFTLGADLPLAPP